MAERKGWEKLGGRTGRTERSGAFGILRSEKRKKKRLAGVAERGSAKILSRKHDSVFGIIDTDGYRANNRRCFNFSSAVAYVQYPSAMAQSQQTRYKPVKFGIVSVYARVAGENFSPEAK